MPRPRAQPTLRLYGPDSRFGAVPRAGFADYIWYIDHGRRRVSTGCVRDDEQGAQDALIAYQLALRKDSDAPKAVAEVLRHYLDERMAGKRREPDARRSAILLAEHFEGKFVADIKPGDVLNYINKRQKSVSSSTVRAELSTLVSALKYAVDMGRLSAAPTISLPKAGGSRERWATRDDVAKLLRRTRVTAPHLARFILVTVYTGHRSEAVRGLRFRRHDSGGFVDLKTGVIDFRRGDGKTNNKRRALIPIPAKLRHVLRRAHRESVGGYVIEYKGGPVGSLKTAWRKATAAAALDGLRLHDLCHTAITWRLHAGATSWEVGALTGRSAEIIHEVYGHHSLASLQAVADRVKPKV